MKSDTKTKAKIKKSRRSISKIYPSKELKDKEMLMISEFSKYADIPKVLENSDKTIVFERISEPFLHKLKKLFVSDDFIDSLAMTLAGLHKRSMTTIHSLKLANGTHISFRANKLLRDDEAAKMAGYITLHNDGSGAIKKDGLAISDIDFRMEYMKTLYDIVFQKAVDVSAHLGRRRKKEFLDNISNKKELFSSGSACLCHSDIHRGNVLFTDKRLTSNRRSVYQIYLIDFELSRWFDYHYELAVVGEKIFSLAGDKFKTFISLYQKYSGFNVDPARLDINRSIFILDLIGSDKGWAKWKNKRIR